MTADRQGQIKGVICKSGDKRGGENLDDEGEDLAEHRARQHIGDGLYLELNGAILMAAGVLVSIIAAGIQASKNVSVAFVFEFDHNGIFHIVQIFGILLLVIGLRLSLLSS